MGCANPGHTTARDGARILTCPQNGNTPHPPVVTLTCIHVIIINHFQCLAFRGHTSFSFCGIPNTLKI